MLISLTEYDRKVYLFMESLVNLSELATDTLEGLSANPKFLLSKYFYDNTGSKIFQDIMHMPEYYLTDCESSIFETQKVAITKAFRNGSSAFDLIELGSGDGSKTKKLLKQLVQDNIDFKFLPVDISSKANEELVTILQKEIPDLLIEEQTGDYFAIMQELSFLADKRRVILFLGSNIGNFSDEETGLFLQNLDELTQPGDQLLIGFDLKKSPGIITNAYNDSQGHTRRFNLNLLTRINRELGANFDITKFEHHTHYDPLGGEVKSFLISGCDQTVFINALEQEFFFEQWEAIFMERSRKYDIVEIEELANLNGFTVKQNFFDDKKYFVDSLWVKE